ncbi:MAG: glycoside hydrolase family 3 C-terminal domain-containing protein [Anaerolineales bacterium]|nr:glycoside hydrolase family 3 C-terminal domain-containing protein [Anaerolineales bacterium]
MVTIKNNQTLIQELLDEMTLDEKLAQLGSYWIYELQSKGVIDQKKIESKLERGIGQITRMAGASTLDPVSAARTANRIQKFLLEGTRLGIPAILHEECCCGAMVLGGTMYPQMIGMASTFQPELAEAMTTAVRKQLLAIGARQGLSPVLDLARDPRWGRVEETFGEDPTLASHFGTAYVRGLQGRDLHKGVMATGKHFIGHSLSAGGLNCGPVTMGWRDLLDIFVVPFEAAIQEAGMASIMNSYPELDGEVVGTSRKILTDLLRGKLGFEGLVVSDYETISMIQNFHQAAEDKSTAAAMALNAGIDVELPTTYSYGESLKAALEEGNISLELINSSVRNHLQKKFDLGLFDYPYVDEGNVLEAFETVENRSLAHDIAVKSMVLLKNENTLPLQKQLAAVAVIGPNADSSRCLLGDYTYTSMVELLTFRAPEDSCFIEPDTKQIATHEIRIPTILEGIKSVVPADTEILYAKGCDNLIKDRSGFDQAVEVARKADAVILALGDVSGLVPSCTTGETRDSANLKLPGVQEELAQAIFSVGKPVVVVLVNGRPYAIPWLQEHADAILEAWLPGEEGGNAIAGILFGDSNPGGKLPITVPRSAGQLPVFYNRKPSGMQSHWYVDYVDEKISPLYEFGFGLSYTTFEYRSLSISRRQATAGEVVDISMEITNSGSMAGDEVVQLYLRDEYASIPRPVKELKGYKRIALEPGESRKVLFHLSVDQLAFHNQEMELVLEPGRILVMLGSSSEDIRLQSEFEITGEKKMVVKKRVYFCPVEVV